MIDSVPTFRQTDISTLGRTSQNIGTLDCPNVGTPSSKLMLVLGKPSSFCLMVSQPSDAQVSQSLDGTFVRLTLGTPIVKLLLLHHLGVKVSQHFDPIMPVSWDIKINVINGIPTIGIPTFGWTSILSSARLILA